MTEKDMIIKTPPLWATSSREEPTVMNSFICFFSILVCSSRCSDALSLCRDSDQWIDLMMDISHEQEGARCEEHTPPSFTCSNGPSHCRSEATRVALDCFPRLVILRVGQSELTARSAFQSLRSCRMKRSQEKCFYHEVGLV